jgi:hypothetical protein
MVAGMRPKYRSLAGGNALPFAQGDRLCECPYVPPVTGEPDSRTQGSWATLTGRLAVRALVSPRLAIDLIRTAWVFRRRNWWRQRPFLPVPDRSYLHWRMYTAYGDEAAVPPMRDVIRFARWRRTTMEL